MQIKESAHSQSNKKREVTHYEAQGQGCSVEETSCINCDKVTKFHARDCHIHTVSSLLPFPLLWERFARSVVGICPISEAKLQFPSSAVERGRAQDSGEPQISRAKVFAPKIAPDIFLHRKFPIFRSREGRAGVLIRVIRSWKFPPREKSD